jgi:hypothetical protein
MSSTQRAALGWALAAATVAGLAVLALSTARAATPAPAPSLHAAATWPAGTWRWEGEFKRKNARDPGGTIQFYGGPTEALQNGHGKFRLGGIAPVEWGVCKQRNGQKRQTLVDWYARSYTTVTLHAKRRFAFGRRSPRASSGPGKFRLSGTVGASGKVVRGFVRGRQRQVLGSRCRAHGHFTARRKEQVG